jgi:hypothetical protein
MLQRRHGDFVEPSADLEGYNVALCQIVCRMFRHIVHGPRNGPIQCLGESNRGAGRCDESLANEHLPIVLHELMNVTQGTLDEVAVSYCESRKIIASSPIRTCE